MTWGWLQLSAAEWRTYRWSIHLCRQRRLRTEMALGRIAERNNRCKQRNESIRIGNNCSCWRQVRENARVWITFGFGFTLLISCIERVAWVAQLSNGCLKYKCELLLDTKNEIQLQHFYFLTRLMQLRQFVVSTFCAKPVSQQYSVAFLFFILSAMADLVATLYCCNLL